MDWRYVGIVNSKKKLHAFPTRNDALALCGTGGTLSQPSIVTPPLGRTCKRCLKWIQKR
jgi:hypothetical protein